MNGVNPVLLFVNMRMGKLSRQKSTVSTGCIGEIQIFFLLLLLISFTGCLLKE